MFFSKIPLNLPLPKGEMTNAFFYLLKMISKYLSYVRIFSYEYKINVFFHFGKGESKGICHDYIRISR